MGGTDGAGELGDGTTDFRNVPAKTEALQNVVSASFGQDTAAAITYEFYSIRVRACRTDSAGNKIYDTDSSAKQIETDFSIIQLKGPSPGPFPAGPDSPVIHMRIWPSYTF